MIKARFLCIYATVVVLACAGACSDGSEGSMDDELPDAITVDVGVKGGTVKARGITLEIPEGAVDKTIRVSVAKAGPVTVAQELKTKPVSEVYTFGPAGTKFRKDVKITFQLETKQPKAEVYFTKEGSKEFARIASENQTTSVSARVKHFSQGFAGVPLEQHDAGLDDAGDPIDERDAQTDPTPDAAGIDAGRDAEPDADAAPDAGVVADAAADSDGGVALDAAADPEAGMPTTHVIVHSRDRFGVLVDPTWAAFQDGQGAWQALTPSSPGVYELDVASARFGVAFVCSSEDLANAWGTITLATTASTSLDVVTEGPPCTAGSAPAEYTLEGTLNLGDDQYWRVGHAHLGSALNFSAAPASFLLGDLFDKEPNDVLFASGPGSEPYAINRFLVRRDLTLSANVTAYDLDMVKEGVDALGTAQAQVLNASANTSVDVRYTTRGTQDGLWLNTSETSGTTTRAASFATLPEAIRRATDRYLLVGSEQSASAWRMASLATYPAAGSLSVGLPAAFPTTFAALTTPYLRPTFEFTPVSGASRYLLGVVHAPLRGSSHAFVIELHPDWLVDASPDFIFPDFSQVPGFALEWVAPSGGSADVKASVHISTSAGEGTLETESGQATTVGGS